MYLTTLAKDGMIVLKRMNVPLYSSKYSKKTYTIHQHLLCLCIKEIQRQSYRDCRDFLDEFDKLQEILELTKVPHFTTMQKSLQRFPPRWYKMILKRLIGLLKSRANAVVDGTGVMQTTASYSYINRIGRTIRKRDYFKIIIVIDPDDGLILTHQGTHGHRHEAPFFIQLLEDIPAELGEVCGDKAFDSEKNQRYVIKHRRAQSYVDVKGNPKRGKHRKRVYAHKHADQWKQRYTQMRNAIESKNFSFKHQFGDYIPGNNIHNRRRYLAIRIFAANLITLHKSKNTILFCVIIEDFYMTENTKFL
jgi:hypothetical protein